ncbi:DUF397 domain-containing protein [Streptomyces sp. TP-A0874]|uniref:DUF397 domain-containing protein n=1 Tax=Streptomyces sp. TP-A0874 TaxID=549819 RepID=UPI000852A12D|nr:DUF397 domain-containing protein [Streptomyces sp. TP-A0874]
METPRDLSSFRWHKSSHSNQEGGACLEVAEPISKALPVRDSKHPEGPVLLFPTDAWSAFLRDLKAGRHR